MTYSFGLLTTAIECESILSIVQKEKRSLQYRKSSLDRQRETYGETSVSVDQDLLTVNAEVLALQTIVATLPECDLKEENKAKLKKAEARQISLNKRDRDYSNIALLTLELDVARVLKEMDEIDGFVNELTTKKATL